MRPTLPLPSLTLSTTLRIACKQAPQVKASLFLLLFAGSALAADWVHEQSAPGAFPLFTEGTAATLVVAPEDFKVVDLAAHDLAADIERVTGAKPSINAHAAGPTVLIGTLGKSPLI